MVQRITIAPQGPEFSRFVMGYWRLMDWNMSARQLVSFIEEHLDLGVTTVDHAGIYGGYQCEAAFGEALKLAPHLRERMEIVSKCGIATTAREENVIGHYITDRDHIIKSAEQSLINLATDHLDLLLIHRPDPLMDADEVADAFKHLHQSGKVRHFGVSNFTPAQFALLQSRLPFTLATNQVEISPVHQPLLLDGTLDQLQQLRVRPRRRPRRARAARRHPAGHPAGRICRAPGHDHAGRGEGQGAGGPHLGRIQEDRRQTRRARRGRLRQLRALRVLRRGTQDLLHPAVRRDGHLRKHHPPEGRHQVKMA